MSMIICSLVDLMMFFETHINSLIWTELFRWTVLTEGKLDMVDYFEKKADLLITLCGGNFHLLRKPYTWSKVLTSTYVRHIFIKKKNEAFGKIYYNSTIQTVLNSEFIEVKRAPLRKNTGKINDYFTSPVITTFGLMMRIWENGWL